MLSAYKKFLMYLVMCMYFVDLLSLVLSKKVTDMSLLTVLVIAGYSSLFDSIGTLLTFYHNIIIARVKCLVVSSEVIHFQYLHNFLL